MLHRTEFINPTKDKPARLTPREREVALLATRGLSNRAIADQLKLTEGTVKIHLNNIFRKLGIYRRASLIKMGMT
jgi:two-component system, NarL family, nitrate/nitrite response regulator NarL